MMNQLTVFLGGRKVSVITLEEDVLIFGRGKSCSVRLNCPKVSRQHTKVYPIGDVWVVEDLGSANGTIVNNLTITTHELNDGDRVVIGSYILKFSGESEGSYANNRQAMSVDLTAKQWFNETDAGPMKAPSVFKSKQSSHRGLSATLLRGLVNSVPILQWGIHYQRKDLAGDIIAGITVAVMLIPQGMAYAMLAGLAPITGLYASFVPLLVYAVLGTSRQLSVGPVALDALLVAAGVGAMATFGSEAFAALVVLLAAMVGGIQLLMGLLRLGFIVNFLSYPVMNGFTIAAAIIIGFSQLKHLFGIPIPQTYHIDVMVMAIYYQLSDINVFALSIGVGSVVLILMLKRIHRRIPGAIIAVIVSGCAVWYFELDALGVQIVGTVPQGLPGLSVPSFTFDQLRLLLPLAATIALVGFMEAISMGKVFAAKNHYRVRANQELLAIGVANVAVSFFKGFPVTGGLSRTAVNAQAGANTALASIITAVLLIVTLLWLTPLFYYLPYAVLAAVIMTAVISLVDIKEIRHLFNVKKSEGGLLILTLLATLYFGITYGLLLGISASILLFILFNTRPNAAILGRLPNTNIFRNIERFPEAELVPGLVILRIDASFYFANTEFLKDKLHEVMENYLNSLETIILDVSSINDLDSSGDTALREVVADLKHRGIGLYIAGVKGPVRDVMKRSGLYQTLGADRFFYTIDAAIKRFESHRTGVIDDVIRK